MRLSLRTLTAALLAAALVVGPALAVTAQQTSPPTLPVEPASYDAETVADLPPLSELPPIEGLDALDPVVDTVTGTVTALQSLVDDTLADVPHLNTLLLQGEDAIDAAIAFSQATFASSPTALLARDDLFADALATGGFQGLLDAPLLLTGSEDLDPRTAHELIRLGVENLMILGAEDAINPLVVQKLELAGLDVSRIGGPTRIETAVDGAAARFPDATTAVLTRAYSSDGDDSQAYADLLAVSPWAAENDWPLLLTQTDVLTRSVRDHLADSSVTDVIIIGGEGAVSAAAEQAVNDLGIATRRVGGANRFATAVAIAQERGFADSSTIERLILAEGGSARDDVWAPGFSAAAHGAQHGAPVLLSDGATLPPETLDFITDGIADNLLDGGPAAICASFVDPIACEAAGLLLLGDLTDALTMLGLELLDIHGVLEILTAMDAADLLPPEVSALLVEVEEPGLLEDPIDTELPDVDDTVEDITDTVDDVLEDPLSGGL